MNWDAVPSYPQPTNPLTSWQRVVPPGKKSQLDWLSITLVTGSITMTRRVRYPFKAYWFDPGDRNTYCATQAKNLTNHYVWGPGLPHSDGVNQVWRTFPLPEETEQNADLIAEYFYPYTADSYLECAVIGFMNDQLYFNFCYKEQDVSQ